LNRNQQDNYLEVFSALCYEVFYKNEHGAKLLQLMENKHFRSPVANPSKEPSWAYFHEGMNEIIRSFSAGIQAHMNLSNEKEKIQKQLLEAKPQKGRPRKPTIRPTR
jgi:hypothetical protein